MLDVGQGCQEHLVHQLIYRLIVDGRQASNEGILNRREDNYDDHKSEESPANT